MALAKAESPFFITHYYIKFLDFYLELAFAFFIPLIIISIELTGDVGSGL